MKNSCSYPGADADTDHNMVMMKVRLRLKKIHGAKKVQKWDVEKLKQGDNCRKFADSIKVTYDKEKSINENWEQLRKGIMKSVEENIGKTKRKQAKKPWITNEMINKMDERRRWKNVYTQEGKTKYKQLNNELRRITDKAREKWWEDQCSELEEMDRKGRSDLVYEKVKKLTENKSSQKTKTGIKNRNGTLLTQPDDVKSRWKEYIEELYAKDEKPNAINLESENETDFNNIGPEIIEVEIREAIKEMKTRKAAGCDGITAEMIKSLNADTIEAIIQLCKNIYKRGEWPKDFLKTIMVPIEKKPNATDCGDFRTISLISHASKIMLAVLKKRLNTKAEEYLGEDHMVSGKAAEQERQ